MSELNFIKKDLKSFWFEVDYSSDDDVDIEMEGTGLTYEFEIDSKEFLEFAKLDLKERTKRGMVNAVSNAKKSIECNADKILTAFGLSCKNNLPSKLEYLAEIGVVAPSIIKKVNHCRNLTEHRFVLPKEEETQEAVDVAELFESSIKGVMFRIATDFRVSKRKSVGYSGSLSFSFNDDEKQWDVWLHRDRVIFATKVQSKERIYIEIVKIAIAITLDDKFADECFKKILAIVNESE